jgi:tetratricopeptide (TPR) repeat protein
MSASEARSERVLELAEEFLERYRKGERPPLKEYIDRHPELAAEIKEVFPAMAMLENIAVIDESLAASSPELEVESRKRPALQQLGDFRIIRIIGHGGMGIVYEAEQVSLGRHVALKLLPNHALHDAKQKLRFEREAKAAAKLHHTNIVPVFGVGENDGVPYYVMQFIQGLGLDAVLDELNHMQPGAALTPTGTGTGGEIRVSRRDVSAADVARSLMTGAFQQSADHDEADGPKTPPVFDATLDLPEGDGPQQGAPSLAKSGSGRLSDSFTVSSSSLTLPGTSAAGRSASAKKQTYWQSVANIGRQVAEALEYAHKQGVLHRDVKPSNLLLDMRGTVWVTDFGLAKVAGPDAENLTHTGDILGTLRYMPPEAFEGRSDARGDVYSLGMTLYELLAMRPAFDEKERNKLIKQVTSGEPTPLDEVRRGIPRDLVTIVQKSIAREPSRRYATAEDLASDLQRFLDDEPIQARRQTQMERYVRWARHNPGIATLGGVLTAVLVLVTVASLIVAGRMSNLAEKETQAAADEAKEKDLAELAKQDAEASRHRAETEKGQAEQAKKAAEESKQQAEKALQKAEENFAKARSAVNDYLAAVSDDERLKVPGLEGLRIQLLQSALRFYQEFLKERGNDPTLRRELAGVYFKVGEIYRDLGQAAAATQAYAQARRLYEALVSESSDDKDLQYGLAMVLYRIGMRAKAIPILEKLINPEDPKYHADLGDLYNSEALAVNNAKTANAKTANAKTAETDNARQLEYLRKSLTVRERLVRLRPDDAEARLGLGGSLNNIAIRLKDDRDAEALALLQRSLEQVEAAHRLRPAHLLTARFLTIGLNNVANRAKKVGETEVVLTSHRRRVEVLDRRARDNPTIPGFDAELAAGYSVLLHELREAGRLEEAAKTAEKARIRLAETTEETTEFFRQVATFHLNMHSLALARAKANPDEEVNSESEAAAAVNAMRQHTLAGWREPTWLRTDSRTEPLRQRGDFKELLARQDEIAQAYAAAQQTTAKAEDKLAARQTILRTLEVLAGAQPHARFVRRNLAQARQDWAQALLETDQVDEARLAFDDALAARDQLVQESPSNEQLRADLAQSQSAAGDLFAAAGKLADAFATWDKALATLEEGLKANPNSIPFRAALSERLLHVAGQAAKFGLWDVAAIHYGRAVEIQIPTEPKAWNFIALAAAKTQNLPLLRAAADLAASATDNTGEIGVWRLRALTASPTPAAAHVESVRKLAEGFQNPWHNNSWGRGLAYLRAGQAEKASQTIEGLKPSEKPWPEWQILALIRRRLGQADAAAEALRQADLLAERRMKVAACAERLQTPLTSDEWLHNEVLRAEAHQAVYGKPMPASPYERLFRGRVFSALGEADKAEAEFTAAVQIRRDDVDVWLTRSRVFEKLGLKDRMSADLLRAQQIKGDDPKTWIETGRQLAERGEHRQADVAFARAAALGKGELNHFLDAGWWAVGPYYVDFNRNWPPESAPDPSKPVAALYQAGDLKWQTAPTDTHTGSVAMPIHGVNTSVYGLNYVYSDRDQTATLQLQCDNDARLWVNGRLVFDGLKAWDQKSGAALAIPITLRAGRNVLLVRVRPATGGFVCRFGDGPIDRSVAQAELDRAADHYARLLLIHPGQPRLWVDRGRRLGELGRWDEAARAFAKAAELAPKSPQVWKERGRAYADLGKWDEAAADFATALALTPAPKGDPTGMSWWATDNEIDNAFVESTEVFNRLIEKRASDLALVARRTNYLAMRGRFNEAVVIQSHAVAMAPDKPVAEHVLALLRLQAGEEDGYRASCRKLIDRFPPDNNDTRARMILTCLLVPDVVEDKAALRRWTAALAVNETNAVYNFHSAAQVLAEYRLGENAVANQLAKKLSGNVHFDSVVRSVEAMALERLGRRSEAIAALRKAQTACVLWSHQINRENSNLAFWWEITRGQVLLREAEALIPVVAEIAAAPATLSVQQENARRDRKARADSLATQAALAQIRFDVGQKTEAEGELRAILAEHEKIAAEEPDNLDYKAELAAAHQQLGQFLVNDGRAEEGVKAAQQAVALLEQFAAGNPKAARYQVSLAANLFGVGDLHRKAGRLAEGRQAWQKALDLLETARGAAAKDPRLAKLVGDLELAAGRAYAELGLWTEASEHFRRAFDVDPLAGKVADRFDHAALLVLTGDEAAYRRYCARVYERSESSLQNTLSARMMVLSPGAVPDPKAIVALAQEVRNAATSETWTVLALALAQLRADQADAAFATFREFETISKGEWQFSWPVLALARHKAGKIDEAREWLRKTEDWYSSTWAKHLVADSSQLPRNGSLSYWTFFLALRQEAIATVTGQPAPADAWLHLHRGQVYAKLGQPEKAEAEFQAAVKAEPDDLRILLSRSQIYAGLGKLAEARADREAVKEHADQALTKRPDDTAAADALAGLFVENVEPRWTALKPLTVKSEGGATLTVQPDDSVLASGKNPDNDVYVIEAEVQGRIGAIRLEAIPDPSMPAGGSGRAPNWGNFVLTDFRVIAGESVVAWSRAIADFSQQTQNGKTRRFPIAFAIDADESTGWAIWPRVAEPHWAVFTPRRPIVAADKTRLTIRLSFHCDDMRKYALGRFRLSVADSGPMQQAEWLAAAETPHAKVGAAFLALGDAPRAKDFLTRATKANPKLPAADWLVLAFAHAQLKEIDQARQACSKAAASLRPAGAKAALRPLVRKVAVAIGSDCAEVKELLDAAAGEVPAALNAAIQKSTANAQAYRARGNWMATHGRWQQAAADFTEVYRLDPSPIEGMKLGNLLVQLGEMDRYLALCRDMLARWSSTEVVIDAERVLKTYLLHPMPELAPKDVVPLVQCAVAGGPDKDPGGWFICAKSLHELRSGKYADALTSSREAQRLASRGNTEIVTTLALIIESMALQHSERPADARSALAEAKSLLAKGAARFEVANIWHDWLAADILYREAADLIENKTAEKSK